MWYKLNQAIGVIFLVAVLGGGAIYGLVSFMSGPPLLRQEGQEYDPRQNAYTRGMVEDFDRHLSDLQAQQARALQDAIETGQRALGN